MTEERLLALQEVSFAYEGEGGQKETVLNRINLDIHKGAFVSVLGHNGSGKSTLAKLMNALLLPKEGTVLVTGIDTRDGELIWEVRRHVGMVFKIRTTKSLEQRLRTMWRSVWKTWEQTLPRCVHAFGSRCKRSAWKRICMTSRIACPGAKAACRDSRHHGDAALCSYSG